MQSINVWMDAIAKIGRLAFTCLFVMGACTGQKSKIDSVVTGDTIQTVPNSNPITHASVDTFEVGHLFDLDSIQVLSTYRLIEDDAEYGLRCKSWHLNAKDIEMIIRKSRVITGSDAHDLYYRLPCRYEADVKINGTEYSLMLNAGSFLYLSNQSARLYLGCSDEACAKFFLESGGNMARDISEGD